MKSSSHSLIPLFQFLLSHLRLPSAEHDRILDSCSARTTQKTRPHYCWEGLLTDPLLNKGRRITERTASTGMCLPLLCLTMGLYVTVLIAYLSLYCNRRVINHGHAHKLWGTIKAANYKSRIKLHGFSALKYLFFLEGRGRRSVLIYLCSKNQSYAVLLL
jgi:hypothetical protein